MNIDSFIVKGGDHKHCEDYVIDGFMQSPRKVGIGIVSDGCGDERAPYTDMGSKILAFAAKKVLLSYDINLLMHEIACSYIPNNCIDFELPPYMQTIIESANKIRLELELPEDSLYATLVFFIFDYEKPDSKITVVVYGDGVVAWKNKESETITCYEIEFLENMPFYPAIYLSQKRVDDFSEHHRGRKAKLQKMHTIIDITTSATSNSDMHHSCPVSFELNLNEIELLVIGTDGLSSLKSRKEKELETTENVVSKILDLKSFFGKFVDRKMQNKIMKEYEPLDDLSLVVFHNPSNIIL